MKHQMSVLPEQLSGNEPLVSEQGEEFELKGKWESGYLICAAAFRDKKSEWEGRGESRC